jgi:hypothetical protein
VRAWPCRQPASAGICLCRAWSVAHRCVNRRRFASKLEFEDRTHAVAMTAVRLVGQVNSVFVFFQCRDWVAVVAIHQRLLRVRVEMDHGIAKM